MGNKKLKEKKKNARKKAVKQKLVNQRVALIKQRKREEELEKESLPPPKKIKPIINERTRMARVEENLKKNMEILAALEEEYQKDVQKRAELNENLEKQGCNTLKEKLDSMNNEVAGESLIERTRKVMEEKMGAELMEIKTEEK
jgi:hypothetical protein